MNIDILNKLTTEAKELEEKLTRLHKFLASDKTLGVPKIQLQLLDIQKNAMQSYLECLKIRIYYLK